MWGWLKTFGKGAAKAAPTILDIASVAMPGPAAVAAHKGADVIRAIEDKRHTATPATPPFVPITSELMKVAEEVVSTVVDKPATPVVAAAAPVVPLPVQAGGSLAEQIAELQQYAAALREVIALKKELGGLQ